jgi:hypothetical protein
MNSNDGTLAAGADGGERRGTGGWENVLDTEAHLVAPGGEWRSKLWADAAKRHVIAKPPT